MADIIQSLHSGRSTNGEDDRFNDAGGMIVYLVSNKVGVSGDQRSR